MDSKQIPIIIPAYEPDEQLNTLLSELIACDITNIIVVNDGSGALYNDIFDATEAILSECGGILLKHDVNRGKGKALRTAFEYILENMPDAIGAVTADSDGQHTVDCITAVAKELDSNPKCLVLGVREFGNKDEIPWKSRFGNELTKKVFRLVSGLTLSDTQTGLRGIPRNFLKELLLVKGDRFEYETRMLLESADRYPIKEVPIETIYESKTNHQTHFKPIMDSLKIYRILFEKFFKYMISSLSSFLVDIILFTLFCSIFKGFTENLYIAASTVVARILSAIFNYLVNYRFVFESHSERTASGLKYIILAVSVMACSAIFVTLISKCFTSVNETVIKVAVDTVLFIVSYKIQKKYVFR